jgi:hypothetical protein
VNPKTNLIVKAGFDERHFSNMFDNEKTQFIYLGITTALHNFYFDF